MRLTLPPSLHYPITVTELLKKPNDEVERSEAIFTYSFKASAPVYDRDGNETFVEKLFPSRFESSVDGIIQKWFLRKGDVISRGG
jgi:RNA polymerase II subunit A C-terminal domain phosphatase